MTDASLVKLPQPLAGVAFVTRVAVMHHGHHVLAALVALRHLVLGHSAHMFHVARVTRRHLLHRLMLGVRRGRWSRRRGLGGGERRSHQNDHLVSPEFDVCGSKLRTFWEGERAPPGEGPEGSAP